MTWVMVREALTFLGLWVAVVIAFGTLVTAVTAVFYVCGAIKVEGRYLSTPLPECRLRLFGFITIWKWDK